MVMGPTHALHGMTAGLAVSNLAPLFGQPMNIPTALTLGGLCAGAAIAPDLDHPGATASRSIGIVSAAASAAVRAFSASVYRRTRTRRDRSNADGHRGITHTVPGAAGLGVISGGIPALAGLWGTLPAMGATLVVIWLFLVWALRALPPKRSVSNDYFVATLLTGGAYLALSGSYASTMPLLIGLTVGLGSLVHTLGDSITDYGSPLAWPFVIRGERWFSCGPPKPMRFKAGKEMEQRFVFPLSIAAAFVAFLGVLPGALPAVGDAVVLLWK